MDYANRKPIRAGRGRPNRLHNRGREDVLAAWIPGPFRLNEWQQPQSVCKRWASRWHVDFDEAITSPGRSWGHQIWPWMSLDEPGVLTSRPRFSQTSSQTSMRCGEAQRNRRYVCDAGLARHIDLRTFGSCVQCACSRIGQVCGCAANVRDGWGRFAVSWVK
jgi:hypothetical protein